MKSFGVSNRIWTLSAWVFLALAGVNQVWADGQDGVCASCQAQVSSGVPRVLLPELPIYLNAKINLPSVEEVRMASIQAPAALQFQHGFEPWGGRGYDPFRGQGFSAELSRALQGIEKPLVVPSVESLKGVFPLF